MTGPMRAVTVATAVGTGAAGGVFFAFSGFVMAALARLPVAQGVAAMQQVNVTAVRPAFMTLLFGAGAGSAVLGVQGLRSLGDRTSLLLVAGAALYLVGVLGTTIVYHVPRNDALAVLDPSAPGTVDAWSTYLAEWTRANHARTASAIAAAAAFTLALLTRG